MSSYHHSQKFQKVCHSQSLLIWAAVSLCWPGCCPTWCHGERHPGPDSVWLRAPLGALSHVPQFLQDNLRCSRWSWARSHMDVDIPKSRCTDDAAQTIHTFGQCWGFEEALAPPDLEPLPPAEVWYFQATETWYAKS